MKRRKEKQVTEGTFLLSSKLLKPFSMCWVLTPRLQNKHKPKGACCSNRRKYNKSTWLHNHNSIVAWETPCDEITYYFKLEWFICVYKIDTISCQLLIFLCSFCCYFLKLYSYKMFVMSVGWVGEDLHVLWMRSVNSLYLINLDQPTASFCLKCIILYVSVLYVKTNCLLLNSF